MRLIDVSLPESQEIKILHITTVDTSLRYLLLNQLISLQNEGYVITTASSPGVDAMTLESRGIRERTDVRLLCLDL